MRIIGTLENERLASRFSSYLNSQKIANRIEVEIPKDWEDDQYGVPTFQIWIIDEEDLDRAMRYFEDFKADPQNSKYKVEPPTIIPEVIVDKEYFTSPKKVMQASQKQSFTSYIILLCILIFTWGSITAPNREPIPLPLPSAALFSPKINKELIYDYPQAFSYLDQLVKLYGLPSLTDPAELPQEGRFLLNQYFKTPWWHGIYPHLLQSFGAFKDETIPEASLFEKIRQGEVWRAFTPALLHSDIFHLLFNMIWLLVLGKQIEERLGLGRYLLLILVAGVMSNTAQYLMSGPNFVGFSGILCAMLTFIWVRQKIAPWEGYLLQKATFMLLMIFILAMFGLQLISFTSEVFLEKSMSIGIANTAHLTGAAVGFVLGRLSFFKWRNA